MKKGIVLPFLLLLASVTLVLGAFFLLGDKPKTANQITVQTASPSPTGESVKADEGSANWKTIRGEISKTRKSGTYKFEFKAPNEFEINKPYPYLPPESDKYYFGAKAPGISFFAGPMEGPGLLSLLHWRAGRETKLCTQPLEVLETDKGSFEVCDILQIGGHDALFLIDVHIRGSALTGSCERSSSFYVVFNLDEESSVMFTTELEILNEIIEPWKNIPLTGNSRVDSNGVLWNCPLDINYSEVKENLISRMANIRNAKNLSKTDTDRLIVLYQILSTLKFTQQSSANSNCSQTAVDASGFKTYTSSQHKFTLKYPGNLSCEEINNDDERILVLDDREKEYECVNIHLNLLTIDTDDVKDWIRKNYRTIRRVSNTNGITNEISEIYSYNQGGINGYWFETGFDSVGKSIIVKKGNRYLDINTPGCVAGYKYSNDPKTLKIMDDMVKSFEFTN